MSIGREMWWKITEIAVDGRTSNGSGIVKLDANKIPCIQQ